MDLPDNLHELKRAALQKLCKAYGIKANMKNADMVLELEELRSKARSDNVSAAGLQSGPKDEGCSEEYTSVGHVQENCSDQLPQEGCIELASLDRSACLHQAQESIVEKKQERERCVELVQETCDKQTYVRDMKHAAKERCIDTEERERKHRDMEHTEENSMEHTEENSMEHTGERVIEHNEESFSEQAQKTCIEQLPENSRKMRRYTFDKTTPQTESCSNDVSISDSIPTVSEPVPSLSEPIPTVSEPVPLVPEPVTSVPDHNSVSAPVHDEAMHNEIMALLDQKVQERGVATLDTSMNRSIVNGSSKIPIRKALYAPVTPNDRFAKQHTKVFDKMLSIEDHLKRKMKKAESIAPPPKKAKVEQKLTAREKFQQFQSHHTFSPVLSTKNINLNFSKQLPTLSSAQRGKVPTGVRNTTLTPGNKPKQVHRSAMERPNIKALHKQAL